MNTFEDGHGYPAGELDKESFITGYLKGLGSEAIRTPDGYRAANGLVFVALPCACNQHSCRGWSMMIDDPVTIMWHNFLHGIEANRPTYEEVKRAMLADFDIQLQTAKRHIPKVLGAWEESSM